MTNPDSRQRRRTTLHRVAVLLLGITATLPAQADEKLDKAFEALDAAFIAFLAEEAQDASQNEQETELAVWLRDWWNPADAQAGMKETAHEIR